MRRRGIRVPFERVVIPPIEFLSILPGHQERPERRRFEREALRRKTRPSLRPVRPSVPSTATGPATRQMTDGRARAEEMLHWSIWGRAGVRTPLVHHRATPCANAAELSTAEALPSYGRVGSWSIPAPPFRGACETEPDLLNLLIREEPNQGFIGQVSNLNAVSPRIPKVATEASVQLEFVL